MKFINKGPKRKIRIGNQVKYEWKNIAKNEEIELEEEIGLANGLEPVKPVEIKAVETKVANKKVETKQVDTKKVLIP